jgi:ureidoacrylate peracid hydrolase
MRRPVVETGQTISSSRTASGGLHIHQIDPSNTRLLVIDIQNDFCHPEGWFARHGNDVTLIREAVDRLLHFLPIARCVGVKPIFVRAIYDRVYLSRPMRERQERLGLSDSCLSGSWGADFFRVGPEEGELSIVKHRYSAFIDTELNEHLRAQRIENLIVSGVTSNVCVESTARDAFMLDYGVVFLSDCSATDDPGVHEGTLRNIRRAFGIVATSTDAISVWDVAGFPVSPRLLGQPPQ